MLLWCLLKDVSFFGLGPYGNKRQVKEVSKSAEAENESEAEPKLASEAENAADSAAPSPEKEELLSSTAGEKTPAKPETLLSTASTAEVGWHPSCSVLSASLWISPGFLLLCRDVVLVPVRIGRVLAVYV